MFKYTGRIRCSALTDLVLKCFSDTSVPRRGGGGGGEGSGGAMVLGKLPVLGRPNNLDLSRARAFCACRRCGWELFGHFFSHLSFLSLSPSLWEAARYRLKYCLKGPLSPKQRTNQLSQGFGSLRYTLY